MKKFGRHQAFQKWQGLQKSYKAEQCKRLTVVNPCNVRQLVEGMSTFNSILPYASDTKLQNLIFLGRHLGLFISWLQIRFPSILTYSSRFPCRNTRKLKINGNKMCIGDGIQYGGELMQESSRPDVHCSNLTSCSWRCSAPVSKYWILRFWRSFFDSWPCLQIEFGGTECRESWSKASGSQSLSVFSFKKRCEKWRNGYWQG